ncbi:MAG: Na+/H+ antiporter subunit G [Polaromonas sp.]|uniref:Na+/H+ antiporter subunit G n=1 Tax=Polaromonas sp. TaxID=1869339 RepID=UPI0027375147|nr:Na+/H+ antiporter subunit G [Polaromonas sp.]MDP2818368.1 Na+/H+ antiporter subunit G [Polaromonas sp.]
MNPSLFELPVALDALLAFLVVIGTVFALIGSWGLARLSDFLKRLHGPTKATTLGVGSILIASAIWFSFARETLSLHELLITLFLFMTAPVSAHLLIKAALKVDPSQRPPPPALPSEIPPSS